MKKIILLNLVLVGTSIAAAEPEQLDLDKAIEKLDVKTVKNILSDKNTVLSVDKKSELMTKATSLVCQKSEKLSFRKSPKDLASFLGGVTISAISSVIFLYYLPQFLKIVKENYYSEHYPENCNNLYVARNSSKQVPWGVISVLAPLNVYFGVKMAQSGWQLKSAAEANKKAQKIKNLLS